MIAKGNSRANGAQLAAHLMNARDNERVEVASIDGSRATDLRGLFAEWALQAEQTRCQQFIYHLSVSPDPGQGPITRDQYLEFMDRAGRALGLGAQARGVVFHAKQGREHGHCAWSRIDVEAGRAIALSHDRMTLRRVVQEFARDHGLTLSVGLQADRGSERTGGQHTEQAEQKQQERSGQTKAERTAILTAAWQQHEAAGAFVQAIEREGFTLARGDGQQRKEGKRSQPVYVVIDRAGEVHSLARQIEGAKAKEIFTRLQDGYALGGLESVETARAVGKEFVQAAAPPQAETIDRDAEAAKSQDSIDSAGIAYIEERRQQLHQTQATERETYERHGDEMKARHAATWGEAIHRHAVEMEAAHGVAPTGYQPGTMDDAGQATSDVAGFSFAFIAGIAASAGDSFLSLFSPTRRQAKARPRAEPEKLKKKPETQQERQKRDQHQQEMNAIAEQQIHEREGSERRHAAMLQEQQRAREHFEESYADPSAMRQAFDIHGGSDSYRADIERAAARKEARQERERGGPEFEGPELKP